MSLAALRWLLPAPLYRAAGLTTRPVDPESQLPHRLPRWPVENGPASRLVEAVLRRVMPAGLVRCRGIDYGDQPGAAAELRYRGPRGGYLRVLRRRLEQPLLLECVLSPARDGDIRIRPTGTEVGHCDDDVADLHRLVIVRPNGTLWIFDSIGLPTAGTGAPLSRDQLDTLASALDDPRADIADGERTAPGDVISATIGRRDVTEGPSVRGPGDARSGREAGSPGRGPD
jgi:hypothetical protein